MHHKNPGKRYCRNCHLEVVPVKQCRCSGGAGPSGCGDEGKGSDKKDMVAASSAATTPLSSQANINKADPEVMVSLITQHILTIDNNMDAGIFSIKINQSLLTESQKQEIQKFTQAIEAGFADFIKKFDVSADKYSFDIRKNASGHIEHLKIVFSSLELYQRFYHHTLKGLLPTLQKQQFNEKREDKCEGAFYTRPTPLSTRLEKK